MARRAGSACWGSSELRRNPPCRRPGLRQEPTSRYVFASKFLLAAICSHAGYAPERCVQAAIDIEAMAPQLLRSEAEWLFWPPDAGAGESFLHIRRRKHEDRDCRRWHRRPDYGPGYDS